MLQTGTAGALGSVLKGDSKLVLFVRKLGGGRDLFDGRRPKPTFKPFGSHSRASSGDVQEHEGPTSLSVQMNVAML